MTACHRIECLVAGIELLSARAEQSERPGGIESGHHHVVVSKGIACSVPAEMAYVEGPVSLRRLRQSGFRSIVHII